MPQTFADRLSVNARLFAEQPFALFVTGATAPTSNIGPWLKDDQTWWVWSNTKGAYIPEILDPLSLRYILSTTAPAPVDFDVWYKLDSGLDSTGSSNSSADTGKPNGIFIYWSGQWTDVYAQKLLGYPTFPQMNTAIQTFTSIFGSSQFKARLSADQNYAFAGAGSQSAVIAFNVEDYDPDNVFGASKFTAPADGYYHITGMAQFELSSGSPTTSVITVGWNVNGTPTEALSVYDNIIGTGNRIYTGGVDFFLHKNDYVQMNASLTVDAACVWRADSDFTRMSGFRTR